MAKIVDYPYGFRLYKGNSTGNYSAVKNVVLRAPTQAIAYGKAKRMARKNYGRKHDVTSASLFPQMGGQKIWDNRLQKYHKINFLR